MWLLKRCVPDAPLEALSVFLLHKTNECLTFLRIHIKTKKAMESNNYSKKDECNLKKFPQGAGMMFWQIMADYYARLI